MLKSLKAALATALFVLFAPAFAQVDWYGLVNAQAAEQQAYVQGIMQQALQQRGPEIQAAYQQHLQAGGYPVTFEEFAYWFVATNGFTDGGAFARQGQANIAAEQAAWQGVQAAEANSAAAIAGLNGNFVANSQEMGNVIVGNASYYGPTGSAVLPYGWQPQSYNSYNGQTYYVDHVGQYYWIDPNNSGWMYPISQGQ